MPSFEDAAKLAKRGMRLFPCELRGKKPVIYKNLERATTDLDVLRGWWNGHDWNIGLATGRGSGIWVLDIDGVDGELTLRRLEDINGPVPPTVEVITGKGRHLYFRWPLGVVICNRQVSDHIPGLDVRGEGGYVLAPPSIHPSGRVYAWSVDSAHEFADAPAWLLRAVTLPHQTATARRINNWDTIINEDVDGSHRAAMIAKLYGKLLKSDPELALGVARIFNNAHCKPPLEDGELTRVIEDIARKEKLGRRGDGG